MIKDKIIQFQENAKGFVEQFCEKFASADKKTYKDHLSPFFGNSENCIDYVNVEAFPKFEDRPADKWNEIIRAMTDESATHVFKALSQKDESTILTPEQILVE